jgi:hypothetical protein
MNINSGIMFPVKCKDLLPLDHLLIKSVAVRGRLGPLTVWVSKDDAAVGENGEYNFRLSPKYWTKLYEKAHPASRREYRQLDLDTPIRLEPGQVKAIYIHSTLPGDEAIVYDNSHYSMMSTKRYEDDKLAILTGRAHVSSQVFGQEPIWGWGNAWRDRREFVGRLEYGTVYKLWNPQVQPKFGSNFQDGARALFLCQRRWESEWSMLPDECIFYILNMCRWDWFDDTPDIMRARRKREKFRMKLLAQAEALASHQNEDVAAAEAFMEEAERPCGGGCKLPGMDEDHEMEDDADEEADDDDDDCDDDDDGEEEWQEDAEEEVDSDEESDDEDQYHRANNQAFTYRDIDSDDDDDDDDEQDEGVDQEATSRREWIRRQFARVHVLRALASMEDGAVAP